MQQQSYDILAPLEEYKERKFIINKPAGQGGQGFVYLAKCVDWGVFSNKEVALKFQDSIYVSKKEIDFLNQLKAYQSFKNEIDQPSNIIKVLDTFYYLQKQGQSEVKYFVLVMEKGEMDLRNYLTSKKGQLSDQEKLQICLDITNPIYFLHSSGYIHRDIKPDNYIKVGEKFKLIDFGLIKQNQLQKTPGVGTPYYSAPEIVSQYNEYNEKVDVWSLACVFYEIFTNKVLFQNETIEKAHETILHHKRNQKPVFDKINQMIALQDFKQLLIQMLSPDANNRISTENTYEALRKISQIKFQFQQPRQVNSSEFEKKLEQMESKINQIQEKNQKLEEKQNKLQQELDKNVKIQEVQQQNLLRHSNVIQEQIVQFESKNQEKETSLKIINDQNQQEMKNQINQLQNQINILQAAKLKPEGFNQLIETKIQNEFKSQIEQKSQEVQSQMRQLNNQISAIKEGQIDSAAFELQITQNIQNSQSQTIFQFKQEIQSQIFQIQTQMKTIQNLLVGDLRQDIQNLQSQINTINEAYQKEAKNFQFLENNQKFQGQSFQTELQKQNQNIEQIKTQLLASNQLQINFHKNQQQQLLNQNLESIKKLNEEFQQLKQKIKDNDQNQNQQLIQNNVTLKDKFDILDSAFQQQKEKVVSLEQIIITFNQKLDDYQIQKKEMDIHEKQINISDQFDYNKYSENNKKIETQLEQLNYQYNQLLVELKNSQSQANLKIELNKQNENVQKLQTQFNQQLGKFNEQENNLNNLGAYLNTYYQQIQHLYQQMNYLNEANQKLEFYRQQEEKSKQIFENTVSENLKNFQQEIQNQMKNFEKVIVEQNERIETLQKYYENQSAASLIDNKFQQIQSNNYKLQPDINLQCIKSQQQNNQDNSDIFSLQWQNNHHKEDYKNNEDQNNLNNIKKEAENHLRAFVRLFSNLSAIQKENFLTENSKFIKQFNEINKASLTD